MNNQLHQSTVAADSGNGFFWKITFLFFAVGAGMLIRVNCHMENNIRANMYATQKMVEDYAMAHDGNYPDDNYLCQIIESSKLKNPYSTKIGAVVPTVPRSKNFVGSVGYFHEGFNRSSYSIYGRERKGLLQSRDGTTFVLTGLRPH